LRKGWKIAFLKTIGVASFQVLLLYASWVNKENIDLCTFIIASACTSLLIQFPLGIGTAAHNLVSQALQYNHFLKARKYASISLIGGLFWGALAALCFLSFNALIIKK